MNDLGISLFGLFGLIFGIYCFFFTNRILKDSVDVHRSISPEFIAKEAGGLFQRLSYKILGLIFIFISLFIAYARLKHFFH